MKVFQIENNICYWDATSQFPTKHSTIGFFPPSVIFVEAPDYVSEMWEYKNGEFAPSADQTDRMQFSVSSETPYQTGDFMIFEDKIYESLVDNNLFSPAEKPEFWKKLN